jgi:tryptophan synthase alpha chain
MSRIKQRFMDLRTEKEKALICYLTAGDPSLAQTREIILGMEAAGVDCVEIGVPFSDPTADGPIIQAASQRAIKNGVTLAGILDMIESLRKTSEIPICLFGYYNPILSFGTERFAATARKAGVDGILVVDLPFEEAVELRQYTDPAGIDFISLIAPTTSTERMRQIARRATGFLYYISITGVTGTARPQVEKVT